MGRSLAGLLTLVAVAGCPRSESDRGTAATRGSYEALRDRGHELFFGRGGCAECHKIGPEGDKVRGPDLAGIAERAMDPRPQLSPIEYVVESIVDPDAVVAPGYVPGVMRRPDQPPIDMTDDEIVALAYFLTGKGDVEAARARIAAVREKRRQRFADRWADQVIARIPWSECDPKRGQELYERSSRRGCGGKGGWC